MAQWTLGPEVNVPLPGSPGFHMRISDDLRKCVVFFGYLDTAKKGGINCIGTGFLLEHESVGYLVTAKHLSHQLGSDPFLIRVNKTDGTSENLYADGVPWFEHHDGSVDVSMVALHISQASGYDAIYMTGSSLLLPEPDLVREEIGVGNFTYTIGLFRLLTGERRNLPICHFGTIALLPGDEKVPVIDWTDPDQKRRIFVEAYLVESQSLAGLSGSPVFVRPEYIMDFTGVLKNDNSPTDPPKIVAGRVRPRLLGLWQGAWEAPPDEVRAAQHGKFPVPVGMGVVVPCQKIIDLLERDDVKKQREQIKAETEPAAKPQAVPMPPKRATADSATSAEPGHRERFNRLLGAAVKPPKSSD